MAIDRLQHHAGRGDHGAGQADDGRGVHGLDSLGAKQPLIDQSEHRRVPAIGGASVSAPACEKECGAFVRKAIADLGADAIVSHLPPLIPSGYAQLEMRCPHGVLWYTEPTSEQIAQWAKDGVE